MRRIVAVVGTLVGAGAVAAALALSGSPPPAPRYAADHPQDPPAAARTVVVWSSMPAPSADAAHLSALLEAGTMPRTATEGEVLTDTDCAPDASMISRCRNEVLLSDGSRLVLRHPHDMRRVPCLAPHERVTVQPAAATGAPRFRDARVGKGSGT